MPRIAHEKYALTHIHVVRFQPKPKPYLIWDLKQKGLALQVRPNGHKSWKCIYSFHNRVRWFHIGHVSVVGLSDARKLAARILFQVTVEGKDPQAAKRAGERPVVERSQGLEQEIADKYRAFIARGIEPECYLYRHYHPDGDLLYVGISLNPLMRQRRHRDFADWRNMICRIVIEPFVSRVEALAAEETAIRTEFPRFNSMHNGHRHPIQELARVGAEVSS
jgi:hypothetical protein